MVHPMEPIFRNQLIFMCGYKRQWPSLREVRDMSISIHGFTGKRNYWWSPEDIQGMWRANISITDREGQPLTIEDLTRRDE